jgi:hypothetical protein
VDALRYGTPNVEYFASILQREDPGGAMFALNFMKYRERADYADGRETTLSGAEADDEYAPVGPLAAVGARPVLIGPVLHHLAGDGTAWDRIGVVRYPTRRSIIEMNMREDFREKHEHKEAGMAFTIVVASFPRQVTPPPPDTDDLVVLQLVADAGDLGVLDGVESTPVCRFSVEDVLIGDDRRFAEARYDLVSRQAAVELRSRAPVHDPDSYAVLVEPFIDELAASAVGDV